MNGHIFSSHKLREIFKLENRRRNRPRFKPRKKQRDKILKIISKCTFYTIESTLKGPYVNQKNTFHQHKPQTNKANTADHGKSVSVCFPYPLTSCFSVFQSTSVKGTVIYCASVKPNYHFVLGPPPADAGTWGQTRVVWRGEAWTVCRKDGFGAD